MSTHDVTNQPPPLEGYDLFAEDRALAEAVAREGAGWATERLSRFGRTVGGEPLHWGDLANQNEPELRTYDRFGHRIDEVEYHPAYHRLMDLAIANEVPSLPWRDPRPGAHVARAALFYLLSEAEAGVMCPMAMTFAVVPAIRLQPEIAKQWEPRFTSNVYDPRMIPAPGKRGATCGMAMTEKQGGSDVRANTTRARALGRGGAGAEYEVTGHKWFCSAPMSDAFLILAHTDRGLSCFLLPRWRPDGTRNPFRIQRLKDKLGNRSNASSEVEFDRSWAVMLGEEGRGVPTILEMGNHTRLECVIGSSAWTRHAVAQALHHCAYRTAFGKKLVDQPLMQNVLADLAIESEAMTAATMRLARSYDEAGRDPRQQLFKRLATAVLKYWVCKRAPSVIVEALECLGGNGYVEESILPRLYREAPLSSVWEGSGNVMCLDVLRALGRSPETLDAFFDEIALAKGAERRLDAYAEALRRDLADFEAVEVRARGLVERLAIALQGSLLVRFSPPEVADAFAASRLANDRGHALGTLPRSVAYRPILERATPHLG